MTLHGFVPVFVLLSVLARNEQSLAAYFLACVFAVLIIVVVIVFIVVFIVFIIVVVGVLCWRSR